MELWNHGIKESRIYGVMEQREMVCCLTNVYEFPSYDGLSLEDDGL